MLRKHILKGAPVVPAPRPDEKDIAAIATVLVTSEAPSILSTMSLIRDVAQEEALDW